MLPQGQAGTCRGGLGMAWYRTAPALQHVAGCHLRRKLLPWVLLGGVWGLDRPHVLFSLGWVVMVLPARTTLLLLQAW